MSYFFLVFEKWVFYSNLYTLLFNVLKQSSTGLNSGE